MGDRTNFPPVSDLDESSSRSVINMKYDIPTRAEEGQYTLGEAIHPKGYSWGE